MRVLERLARETGREYALRVLKENIVGLDLLPGSMLSENEIASCLNLSRTPVREAFIELSKVKIVEIYPQKGSVVSLIDYNMVEEARFMRYVLESAVVELVCQKITPDWIRKLEENVTLTIVRSGFWSWITNIIRCFLRLQRRPRCLCLWRAFPSIMTVSEVWR